jgi:Eukaryotic aspartyl protease
VTDYLNSDNWTPDGLLGLGFPIISVFDEPTVFDNLVANGEASSSVFALKLNGHDDELTLGGLNPSAFSGTPVYTPVTQDGFWQIKLSSFKVGDEDLTGPTHALVDSVCLESI